MAKLQKQIREFLASIGSKGGSATSEAKAAAVRANGKKGGRPKGSKNKPKAKTSKAKG